MTLVPKTLEWLNAQGFSLEMRAAAAFRAAGFEIRLSTFYSDPESGKSREIDVVALDPDYLGVLNIRFIVECKGGTKPWVLLCSPDTLRGYNRIHAFAATSSGARKIMAERDNLISLLNEIHWFEKDGLIGYSFRQALSEKDTAYEAAIGVAKACNAFVKEQSGDDWIAFAFPVIVVEGPLLRGWLAENGDVQLEEITEGEFLFGQDFSACIRVLTASHLPIFAREAKKIADQLRSELNSEVDQIRESWGL